MKQNSQRIIIPFNRQQLADYLSVDRSALSNELSKMQKEGIISYYKNKFYLMKLQKNIQTSNFERLDIFSLQPFLLQIDCYITFHKFPFDLITHHVYLFLQYDHLS